MTKAELMRRLQIGTRLNLAERTTNGIHERQPATTTREIVALTGSSFRMRDILDTKGAGEVFTLARFDVAETSNGFALHWMQRTNGVDLVPRMLRYEWGAND